MPCLSPKQSQINGLSMVYQWLINGNINIISLTYQPLIKIIISMVYLYITDQCLSMVDI